MDSTAPLIDNDANKVMTANTLATDAASEDSAESKKSQTPEKDVEAGGDVEIAIKEEPTVQQLIHDDPRVACDILEKRAKKKLKTFPVKVGLPLAEFLLQQPPPLLVTATPPIVYCDQ